METLLNPMINSSFSKPADSWRRILMNNRTHIMGIINLAPDSFCAASRCLSVSEALERAQAMVAEGASLIDIGAEPTNPSLHPVLPVEEELARLIPIVEHLSHVLDVPISVDTSKAAVITAAVAAGATLINDVRALREPGALEAVANTRAAVCLMYMKYPHGKTKEAVYDNNIVLSTKNFLAERLQACIDAGIEAERIILDPGIGHGNFGKDLAQNLCLLRNLKSLDSLGRPLMIGVSRKTFIGELLNLPETERLYGSLGATIVAVMQNTAIVRTHDVKATVQAVRIAEAILAEREIP